MSGHATVDEDLATFVDAHPEYLATSAIDALRAAEYSRLDAHGHVYLDYTGGGLYADSQLRQHLALLQGGVFGNPHSRNPTSSASTRLDESARAFVLEYFRASPDEYAVVFTANASGALKLVGESYPFGPGSRYLLTFDNHNSVNGIREFARAKGATVTYLPVVAPDLCVDEATLAAELDCATPEARCLLAYPAQSNFSGVQHPLEWIAAAQAKGWDVLLDAAAFAPTNRLDLSVWKPDFVDLSFYKMFGYPTGVGALVARREALARLQRPWFAGGTIEIASVQGDGHYLHDDETAFEDGTIDYLNLPAVEIGLRHLDTVGIEVVHARVTALTGWLLEQLVSLRHRSGTPLVRVYGPVTTGGRGATVALNLFDPLGALFDWRAVETAASEAGISLRTGCFCNPGAGEVVNGLSADELKAWFDGSHRMTFDQFIAVMDGRANGAVRVSLGIVSTFADVHRFVQFAGTFVDRTAP
jgi:selenocysteine lyase/cysteine desulfurase